jgi:hypothetical protein
VGEVSGIPNVDPNKAANALAFHREIEGAVERNRQEDAYRRGRYAIFPVVGTHQPTFQSARLGGGGVELLRTHKGQDRSGDGTVPRVSATPLELSGERREMYAATSHGSLQNADATLTQLFGALTGLYFDLGDFRRAERDRHPVHVGLEVEDLYEAGLPIELRALVDTDADVALQATVSDADSGAPVAQVPLRRAGDQEHRAELPPLPEGSYRVRVAGDAATGPGVEPAEDSFVTFAAAGAS